VERRREPSNIVIKILRYKPEVGGLEIRWGEWFLSTYIIVRFEVFTAATMKIGVFLNVTPCGSCKN
jgi:hypothetical protein